MRPQVFLFERVKDSFYLAGLKWECRFVVYRRELYGLRRVLFKPIGIDAKPEKRPYHFHALLCRDRREFPGLPKLPDIIDGHRSKLRSPSFSRSDLTDCSYFKTVPSRNRLLASAMNRSHAASIVTADSGR